MSNEVLELVAKIEKKYGIVIKVPNMQFKLVKRNKDYIKEYWVLLLTEDFVLNEYIVDDSHDRLQFLSLLERWARIELEKAGYYTEPVWEINSDTGETTICEWDVYHLNDRTHVQRGTSNYLETLLISVGKLKEADNV